MNVINEYNNNSLALLSFSKSDQKTDTVFEFICFYVCLNVQTKIALNKYIAVNSTL